MSLTTPETAAASEFFLQQSNLPNRRKVERLSPKTRFRWEQSLLLSKKEIRFPWIIF